MSYKNLRIISRLAQGMSNVSGLWARWGMIPESSDYESAALTYCATSPIKNNLLYTNLNNRSPKVLTMK